MPVGPTGKTAQKTVHSDVLADWPQCNAILTEGGTKLTRIPAGEDDSLDEGNGQEDGRGAREASMQRRLKEVLIRSPPDWSHRRCRAALMGGGGLEERRLVVVKMEEAFVPNAPRHLA